MLLPPKVSLVSFGLLYSALLLHVTFAVDYTLLGITGSQQEGFPNHKDLHYHSTDSEEHVTNAISLGRGLVRGYKSFLDVMEPGWREFVDHPKPQQPVPINAHVFASGCWEHAHEYWLYLVDSRQMVYILHNLPRFLSLTADTGSVELDANGTTPWVRDFLRTYLSNSTSSSTTTTSIDNVAIPLVTCVHFRDNSHIPMPPVTRLHDGILVTNYPDSLALWAQVQDSDRTAVQDTTEQCQSTHNNNHPCPPKVWVEAVKAEQRYWDGVQTTLQHAQRYRPDEELVRLYAPPFRCKQTVRFGVGKDNDNNDETKLVRIPHTLPAETVKAVLKQIGHDEVFASETSVLASDKEAPTKEMEPEL